MTTLRSLNSRLLATSIDPRAAASAVAEYESKLCARFGSRYAVAVSSGTAAIHCALASLGITRGDEVILPSLAVPMSVAPVLLLGATPVCVDSAMDSIDFNYEELEARISARTRAILVVHLWGFACNMARLTAVAKRRSIPIVEDACQAHGSIQAGAMLGTIGQLGCFSTHSTKILATGEGGFVLTANRSLAEAIVRYRDHGRSAIGSYDSSSVPSFNFRLGGPQAILGCRSLDGFEAEVARRQEVGRLFMALAAKSKFLAPYSFGSDESPNFSSAPMLLPQHGVAVARRLHEQGIRNSVGSFGLVPLERQPQFRRLPWAKPYPRRRWHAKLLLDRVIAIDLAQQFGSRRVARVMALIENLAQRESDSSKRKGTRL